MLFATRLKFLTFALAFSLGAGAQSVPTWTKLRSDSPFATAMGGSDPGVFVMVLQNGDQVRTLDGGKTWSSFTVQGVRPNTVIASPSDPRTFYALTGPSTYASVPSPLPNLYRSRDAAATWELVRAEFGTPSGDLLGNVVVGSDPNVLYATRMTPTLCSLICGYEGVEVFGSVDGGATWRSLSSGITGRDVHVYVAPSDPMALYATSRDGIFHSSNAGVSWQSARPSYDISTTPQLAVDRKDAAIVYTRSGALSDIWASEDAGATWRLAPPLDAHRTGSVAATHLLTDPAQRSRVYYVGDQGHVFESDDAARSWKRVVSMSDITLDASPPPVVAANAGSRAILARSGTALPYRLEIAADALVLGSDLWWNPGTPGIGFTITQHGSGKVFMAWYGYNAQGNPLWRVMPGGTWSDSRTFTGPLYETRGPPYFQGSFDPSRVSVAPAGTATLRFASDSSAELSYRLADASQGVIPIVREQFAAAGFEIPDYSDLWWNPDESGWGIAVNQQYDKIFASWYVYDDAGNPLWMVLPDSTFSYDQDGTARFRGDLYTTTGPPSGQPFDPALVKVTRIGFATLLFSSRSEGVIIYNAFGKPDVTRRITRQPF